MLDPQSVITSEMLAELNERIDILMAENGLLAEQKLALSSELDQHNLDLNNRTQEIKSLSAHVTNLKRENQQLKQTLSQVEVDRDEAANQALVRYRTIN